MSMCTIVPCSQNLSTLPVTRSSNRTPKASSRSAPSATFCALPSVSFSNSPLTAQLAYAEPCMPSQRSDSSCVSGNAPTPMMVVVTGMPVASTSRRSASLASALMMPPPT